MRSIFSLLIGFLLLSCSTEAPQKEAVKVKEEKKVYQAAVSSVTPEATWVGKQILEQGGNAFDAAVAVQFALAVTYPRAGNLGGGGFAVICTKDGEINSLDFREKAPLKASKDMYLDKNGLPIKDKSLFGALAAGVPGTVKGMWELQQKYGSLSWEEVLAPAIELASEGFVISKHEAERLELAKDDFVKANEYKGGPFLSNELKQGDTLIQSQLAASLSKLAKEGEKAFYDGEIGMKMVNDIQQNGGIISLEDLLKYEAVWRDPVIGYFGNYEIVSMGPPSSGGIALIQLLNGAHAMGLSDYHHHDATVLHLYTEMMRRVYADRTRHLGDPDFYPVPIEKLIHPRYLEDRFTQIDSKNKTNSSDIKPGKAERIESFETTHFSVLDKEGNAVSMTITLNSSYGCKLWLPSVGFFLNNEMDDFSVKDGVPNQFGLIGEAANAIEPEKRMLSSMSPTIVRMDKEPVLIVGTPGGSTIITTVFQVIMNVCEFMMPLQEAVNSGRIHHQWQPDMVNYEEGRISGKNINDFRARGHLVLPTERLGIVNAIQVLGNGKTLAAADTTRYMGSAIVLD